MLYVWRSWDGILACLQKVADSLGLPAGHTLVVPFDLCAPYEELEKAAAAADAAFGGAGIDYLVHNAGEPPIPPGLEH